MILILKLSNLHKQFNRIFVIMPFCFSIWCHGVQWRLIPQESFYLAVPALLNVQLFNRVSRQIKTSSFASFPPAGRPCAALLQGRRAQFAIATRGSSSGAIAGGYLLPPHSLRLTTYNLRCFILPQTKLPRICFGLSPQSSQLRTYFLPRTQSEKFLPQA